MTLAIMDKLHDAYLVHNSVMNAVIAELTHYGEHPIRIRGFDVTVKVFLFRNVTFDHF